MKVKLSFLVSLNHSADPAILEVKTIKNDPGYLRRSDISQETVKLKQKVEQEQTEKVTEGYHQEAGDHEEEKRKWNSKLQSLQVLRKFSEVITLKEDTQDWSWIIDELPKGQLPLLLKASSAHCPLWWTSNDGVSKHAPCAHDTHAPLLHILTGCPTALKEGRYMQRHDSVLLNLWHSLQSQLRSTHTNSQPSDALKPPSPWSDHDHLKTGLIVVIKERELHWLELTVCGNTCEALAAAIPGNPVSESTSISSLMQGEMAWKPSTPQLRLVHLVTTA